MRERIILAIVIAALTSAASGARAEDWCGYNAAAKSMIECGYSGLTECETATGKGGRCFVGPDYAVLDTARAGLFAHAASSAIAKTGAMKSGPNS